MISFEKFSLISAKVYLATRGTYGQNIKNTVELHHLLQKKIKMQLIFLEEKNAHLLCFMQCHERT